MNEEVKHTPGPWHPLWAGSSKDGQFVYDEVYVYAPESGVDDIALAADIVDPATGKPSIANARLIAAAPDLLAALVEMEREKTSYMLKNNLGDPSFEHTNKMARTAIAKATGAA